MRNWWENIGFVVALLAVSVFYGYHEIALKRPQSTHKWRQSDCASIALNYYQGGMRFFEPQTHNLTSDNGTSGYNATSEIPILYYTTALLYHLFGYHDYVYRIFNTLLFFLGLFYLFKTFGLFGHSAVWSGLLTLFVFSSPLLVYYGNNFLSNSTALSFSFIGWFFFFRYTHEKKIKWYWISMLIFGIAASFKITALFSVFAITGLILLEHIGVLKSGIFSKRLVFFIPVLAVLTLVSSWITYAHYYNSAHQTTYFSTTIFPIWKLSTKEISNVFWQIRTIWLPHYYHWSALAALGIGLLYWIFSYTKANKIIWLATGIIAIEIGGYIALQFWTFADHDYYTINMYILPVLLLIGISNLAKQHYPRFFNSKITLLMFAVFVVGNMYNAQQKLDMRYNSWMNDYTQNETLYTITPDLRNMGLQPADKVIFIPDWSHASLYLMNQKGWTEYTDTHFNRGEKTYYNQDRKGILKSLKNGAKYLIVNGIEQLYKKSYLQEFATHLKGNINGVLIFDLTNKQPNFALPEKQMTARYFCNAERLTSDGFFFLGDSLQFGNPETQTTLVAKSGNYSIQLDSEHPYGMTITLSNIYEGESFRISVWIKSALNTKAAIVASSSNNTFYHTGNKTIETDSSDWKKMFTEFTIPQNAAGTDLKVYLFNPNHEPVFFDDLEIVRYRIPGY